jgi:hypothetical protein
MDKNKINRLLEEVEASKIQDKEQDEIVDDTIEDVDVEETDSTETEEDLDVDTDIDSTEDVDIEETEEEKNNPIEVTSGIDENGNIINPVEAILKPGDIVTVVSEEGSTVSEVEADPETGELTTTEIESDLDITDSDETEEDILDTDDVEIENEPIDNEIEDSEEDLDLGDDSEEEGLDDDDFDILAIIDNDDEDLFEEEIGSENAFSKDSEDYNYNYENEKPEEDFDIVEEEVVEEDINISYDNDDINTDDEFDSDLEDDLNVDEDTPANLEDEAGTDELDIEKAKDAGLGDLVEPDLVNPESGVNDTTSDVTSDAIGGEEEINPENIDNAGEGTSVDSEEDTQDLVVDLLSDEEELEYMSDLGDDDLDLKEAKVIGESVVNKEISKLKKVVKQLQLENYKLLKVNGLLNVLPELSATTREHIAESFDKCSSTDQVKVLYEKVIKTAKQSKETKLNTLITESNKSFNTTGNFSDKQLLEEGIEDQTISEDQKRINHLMGMTGYSDNYYTT